MPRRSSQQSRTVNPLLGAFASTISLLRWMLAALLVIYLISGVTRVGPNEDALIYRLGRLQREIHPPGLLFALPPPIDRVVRVPTRTQHEIFLRQWSPEEESPTLATATSAASQSDASITSSVSTATMPGSMAATAEPPKPTDKGLHPFYNGYTLTGDVNLIQARLIARYRINDPLAYEASAASGQGEKFIENILFASATQIIAAMKVDDVLGNRLDFLRDEVIRVSQEKIDRLHLGVEIVAFEINTITPPGAVVAAFAEVTSAQVEARTLVEKARTYRAQIQPYSQAEAFRIRQQGDADSRQMTTRASAEAASFLALEKEARANPSVVKARLKAETMESVFSQIKTSTVLPSDDGSVDLLLRPNP